MIRIRNQAKQSRLQSLYQCDKIIICLFVLFNVNVILKLPLNTGRVRRCGIADIGFSPMTCFAAVNAWAVQVATGICLSS